jgi:hypothetical protein
MDISSSGRTVGRLHEETRKELLGMTTRFHGPTILLLTAFSLVALIAVARGDPSRRTEAALKPLRLADATMIVEVNATDGDAGLQVFLDGEPWRTMRISGPDGRRLLEVSGKGRLKRHGLTELFSESSEPPFGRLPLRRFKARFPEGRYTFAGRTVQGRRLLGSATLSHDIPDGPEIVSPAAGAPVPRDNVLASWNRVAEQRGIDVVGYRAIVEREDPFRVFSVDLPASVTSVTIPSQFLKSGGEHKLEVQAIEASGNQTITEISFRVS